MEVGHSWPFGKLGNIIHVYVVKKVMDVRYVFDDSHH